MHRVRMLIYFGVTPYLVFDGDHLPSKAGTERDRACRRDESRRRGLELYKAGKISQAHQELQKAVDVTPYMARQLIEELKRANIQYVVAPYEADAQLVYLERKDIINGILSEDSDLLVFGARRLLTKLDQHGECVAIDRVDFASCREVTLAGWTDAEFRRMAILSGCDYLPNISKMGLKTAYRYVRKYKTSEKVVRMLQFEGQFVVPPDYLDRFERAELTFLHHRVFCPITKKLVFLTALERGTKEEDLPFIGADVDPEVAIGVACGDLDPMTKRSIAVGCSSSAAFGQDSRLPVEQSPGSFNGLKPSKSIESFFRPKRQPLAELDANSFTPSPGQRRLLRIHSNASWEPRAVSSAPQVRRLRSDLPQPRTAGQGPTGTDRAAFLTRAATISVYQPPKRQRLCSDGEGPASAAGTTHSPYFVGSVEEPSPSVRRKSKTKKARKSDFGVYTDESTDDVQFPVPDFEAPAAKSSLEKLAEEPVNLPLSKCDTGARPDDLSSQEADAVPETSPCRSPESTSEAVTGPESGGDRTKLQSATPALLSDVPRSVSLQDDPDEFVDLLELHVRMQNECLRKTFVVQPPARQRSALQSLIAPSVAVDNPPTRDSLQRTFSSQTLEQQATALSRLGNSPGPNVVNTDETHLPRLCSQPFRRQPVLKAATTPSTVEYPSGDIRCLGREQLTDLSTETFMKSSSTPLQATCHQVQSTFESRTQPGHEIQTSIRSETGFVAVAEGMVERDPRQSIRAATEIRGSEDLIVPDSEDESEYASAEEGTLETGGTVLGLGRFVYTAT